MKRSRAVVIGRGRAAGLVSLVGIGLTGCWATVEAFRHDDAAAVAACTPPASASTRAGFVTWASRLVYMRDSARGRLHGFQDSAGRVARLEITSPDRSLDRVRQGCVIGRIVSNYADSAFGFIVGTTYIWADSSSPNSAQLVPDDGTSDMTGYNLAVVDYPAGKEPVAPAGTPAKHICQECAKSDWCVYPRDVFRVVEPAPPDVAP